MAERAFALRYMDTDGDEIHWDMIRLAFSSVADTAIIPLARHPRAGHPRPDEHARQARRKLGMAVPDRARSTAELRTDWRS